MSQLSKGFHCGIISLIPLVIAHAHIIKLVKCLTRVTLLQSQRTANEAGSKGHASRVTLSASKTKGSGQVVLATLSETDPSQLC